MKITVSKTENPDINFITKITLIILGIFITSSIFSVSIKNLDTSGIWIAFLVSIVTVGLGFYYTNSKSKIRFILWGIIGTLVIGTAAYFIIFGFLTDNIEQAI